MGVFNYLSSPVVSWLNVEREGREFPLSDYERIRFELKPCDVLLVEGRSRVSEVIKLITQSPWSHAALYVGRIHDIEDPDLRELVSHYYRGDPGDRLLIESLLGHGTIVRNLEAYRNDHLRICRPSRLTHGDAQQIVRYAVSRLGVDYDVRQIFDLARFFFPWWILPRRFRSSLFRHNAGRSTRTVCSTMIAEAFSFVQFPILPLVKASEDGDAAVQMFRRNPKLCTPSDFDYSPYFEIIKYPFVDVQHGQDYHLLPWKGTGELDRNEAEMYLEADSSPTPASVDEAIKEAIARNVSAQEDETEAAAEVAAGVAAGVAAEVAAGVAAEAVPDEIDALDQRDPKLPAEKPGESKAPVH